MKTISRKNIIYVIGMIAIGVLLNRCLSLLSSELGLPLYMDSMGTMFIAVLGGTFPGMSVGFITNMLAGFSDTNSFYYGTINVLIAAIAVFGANRGWFEKIYKLPLMLPLYMLLSLPCSFLTYILFEFQVGANVASGMVSVFRDMGLPVLPSQMLGDLCIEIPDKLISLLIAFCLLKLVPETIKKVCGEISGRELRKELSEEDMVKRSSLRTQIAVGMFIAGFAIMLVAFFISYKSYMETEVAGYGIGDYSISELRIETLLYSGKMVSAVLGLLMCIVAFVMVLADYVVVIPLHKMATEMRIFAYDSERGRDDSIEKIKQLDIHTGNEIEELYDAMSKTVEDIDNYIDKTNEQANTISELHVNIITTLADIVESRDETTGFHVKRTAEYCAILAEKLMKKGLYLDEINDEYIDTLTIAAPLHDIGKIKIPDAILNKPGRLTDEEFEIIKTHTTMGKEMLDNATATLGATGYLHMATDIAYYHHEWWDGSRKGYPTGKSGTDIPLSARIMAVADVFDALVSKRPYKDGFSIEKALEIMVEERGTHFDPEIIDVLLDSEPEIEAVMKKYN